MISYAVTIFLSGVLLFQVQPMVAKMILPWFGGSASLWITCMVFFQVTLLAGYIYAHMVCSRLTLRRQRIIHMALLLTSLLFLPMQPDSAWKPVDGSAPISRILLLLAATVGLPYFLLSTTSPLMQAWYARRPGAALPYRLFALSNLAALLSLLAYPFAVEPFISLPHQSQGWSIGYGVFVVLCATVAARSRSDRSMLSDTASLPIQFNPDGIPPTLSEKLKWLLLAGCASMLLLSVSNHLTQNVASVPFLWVMPLSLYLITFTLCFDRAGWYSRRVYVWIGAGALGLLSYGLVYWGSNATLWILVPSFGGGLFLCCMICHGELARRKPAPRYLTSFYLQIALGGALGGILVGLAAPSLFQGYYELPISIIACALILLCINLRKWILTDILVSLTLIGTIVAGVIAVHEYHKKRIDGVRNFYGTLRVYVENQHSEDEYRKLINGEINHGEQYTTPEKRRIPLTYYGATSGIGRAIRLLQRRGPMDTAVVGLGIGTLAAYQRKGDTITFYEINPAVEPLVRRYFTYLADTPGAVRVVHGDGRLSLQAESGRQFDLIAVDAFSSDSIPVHLLTKQALALYFQRLKPDGLVAIHISNKHLDLRPVVAGLCQDAHKACVLIDDQEEEDASLEMFGTDWAIASNTMRFADSTEFTGAVSLLKTKASIRLWTDDFNNLITILKRNW